MFSVRCCVSCTNRIEENVRRQRQNKCVRESDSERERAEQSMQFKIFHFKITIYILMYYTQYLIPVLVYLLKSIL